MARKIFLLDAGGRMSTLEEGPYASEDELQRLVADFPELLPADLVDEESPRRWLLVRREVGIPDREDGSSRWSLDHLFLDQDGVPTLIEVKRASDPRLRREVVGQLLDYAANGVLYWPVETLRALFEAECRERGLSAEDRLDQHLGPLDDPESFWQRVKTNLQAGRLRLVVLADAIPNELRRVVEFLNEQMDPAEVLAVSLGQFAGGGVRTLVPQVVGRTAAAETRKGVRRPPKRQWDEATFFAALEERFGDSPTTRAARRLHALHRTRLPLVGWGNGATWGSCFLGAGSSFLCCMWTYGRLELQFQELRKRPPFDDATLRRDLARRLGAVPGFDVPPDAIDRRPNVDLALLADDATWTAFTTVVDWFADRVQAREGRAPDDEAGPHS